MNRFWYAIAVGNLLLAFISWPVQSIAALKYTAGVSERGCLDSCASHNGLSAMQTSEGQVKILSFEYDQSTKKGVVTIDMGECSAVQANKYVREDLATLLRDAPISKRTMSMLKDANITIESIVVTEMGLWEVEFSIKELTPEPKQVFRDGIVVTNIINEVHSEQVTNIVDEIRYETVTNIVKEVITNTNIGDEVNTIYVTNVIPVVVTNIVDKTNPDSCKTTIEKQPDDDFRFLDLSELEVLLRELIAFDKVLLDNGQKATSAQIDEHSSIAQRMGRKYMAVLQEIMQRAASLPVDRQEQFAAVSMSRFLDKVLPYILQINELEKAICNAGIVRGKPIMSDAELLALMQQSSLSKDASKMFSGVNSAMEQKPIPNNGAECACSNPDPGIVLPPTGTGWANCKKCNKLIGLVIVHHQSKKISVLCDNPAGKAAIIKNLTSAFQGNNKSSYADFSIQ